MKSFRDLIVYQKAYQLAVDIYTATKKFPKAELFGIVSQMRRSSVSIPCNISEGYCRNYRKEYVQFLNIAFASCGELETLLSLSRDLGYLAPSDFNIFDEKLRDVSRLLWKLIVSLKGRETE